MPDNAIKNSILSLIKNSPSGVSEHELMLRLQESNLLPALDEEHSNLTLFRNHFLIMNALYQWQAELFEAGVYLSISPLVIRLEPVRNLGMSALPTDGAEARLREYYLDWDHLDQTNASDVDTMLNRFWERYLAVDKRVEALETLGLPADAKWVLVKRTYRRLAAQHHPDKGGDPERFRVVREAYEILLHCYAP